LFAIAYFILQDHEFGVEPLEERIDLLNDSSHFNGKHFQK